jgi:hypothetical protein
MTPRRLLACAAILHVALAVVVLFIACRARVGPTGIHSDGIIDRAAHDSGLYQRAAIPIVHALLRRVVDDLDARSDRGDEHARGGHAPRPEMP